MMSLINNVLFYMKLGSGHVVYDITGTAVDDILDAVDDLIRPQMEIRRLHYTSERAGDLVRVRADRQKLEQILLNLLSNALKFTDAGGQVSLDCLVETDTVSIRVRDTGAGIPADNLAIVFEPYVQMKRDASRRRDGTGLGLAISRDFARGMREITVDSEFGKGWTFTVVLPRSVGHDPATV